MGCDCTFAVMTAASPGAIGIVQIVGAVRPVLAQVSGIQEWPLGRMRLVDLAGVDTGLAARVGHSAAQLMPHGGPRVMQALCGRLRQSGVEPRNASTTAPIDLYPEASDVIEAIVLSGIARAESPLAIDLLLQQTPRWRQQDGPLSQADHGRSRRLNRLITPPRVVLAGPPNVGKSTLSNALLGRSMSIALDLDGTTRDYTSGRIELEGLVVDWYDTPGLRRAVDAIEARAIELAARLIATADCLIAITDAQHEWPELGRAPDLRVAAKADLGSRSDADLRLSAVTGQGLGDLAIRIRQTLVPDADRSDPRRWLFDQRLAEAPTGV